MHYKMYCKNLFRSIFFKNLMLTLLHVVLKQLLDFERCVDTFYSYSYAQSHFAKSDPLVDNKISVFFTVMSQISGEIKSAMYRQKQTYNAKTK